MTLNIQESARIQRRERFSKLLFYASIYSVIVKQLFLRSCGRLILLDHFAGFSRFRRELKQGLEESDVYGCQLVQISCSSLDLIWRFLISPRKRKPEMS